MGCSMQAEDSVVITARADSTSLPIPQSWLIQISSDFQSRNLPRSRLVEVSSHFQSCNLSQSRLTDVSPDLYPGPPIARPVRLRVLLGSTLLLQQGIRIHTFPLSRLSTSPSSTRPLIGSFALPSFPSLCLFMYYDKHIFGSIITERLYKDVKQNF